MRALPTILLVSVCSVALFCATEGFARPLEIVFADMEGGAGILIVTPDGESVLIDCGSRCPDERDARRIAAAAKALGLEAIDHLVITHYHSDHWGGALQLSRLVSLRRFYDHGPMEDLPEDKRYASYLADYEKACKGIRTTVRAGDRLPLTGKSDPAVEIRCVAARALVGVEPSTACAVHPRFPEDKSDNARSIALVLEHGGFRVFLGADITKNVEHDLVCPANRIGVVDLFQVNHHGLRQSNNPLLCRAIDPMVALMLNGRRKGAHPEVVAALKSAPNLKAVYQLHKNAVRPEVNPPDNFIANPEPDTAGTPIRVTCDLASQRFAVRCGFDGEPTWYPIRRDKPAPERE